MEPVEPVQMNIYQSNTYKKDFKFCAVKKNYITFCCKQLPLRGQKKS